MGIPSSLHCIPGLQRFLEFSEPSLSELQMQERSVFWTKFLALVALKLSAPLWDFFLYFMPYHQRSSHQRLYLTILPIKTYSPQSICIIGGHKYGYISEEYKNDIGLASFMATRHEVESFGNLHLENAPHH